MDEVIRRARRRVTELKAELEELEQFLRTAEKFDGGNADAAADPRIIYRKPRLQESCNIAEQLLRQHGPLHVRKLIEYMIQSGWRSSGDERLDYKNMFANLRGQPDRFKKLGRGMFSLQPVRGKFASVQTGHRG